MPTSLPTPRRIHVSAHDAGVLPTSTSSALIALARMTRYRYPPCNTAAILKGFAPSQCSSLSHITPDLQDLPVGSSASTSFLSFLDFSSHHYSLMRRFRQGELTSASLCTSYSSTATDFDRRARRFDAVGSPHTSKHEFLRARVRRRCSSRVCRQYVVCGPRNRLPRW